MSVHSHHEFDNHEQVHFFNDEETGLKAIVAIHNTNLGPALGGCRMWEYDSDEAALNDVLRLSRGMTYKSAVANIGLGGGKSVIIGNPRKHKNEAILEMMGRCLEKLGGSYIAAEDSGTSVADLKVMGRHTRHVAGITERTGINGQFCNGDPSPATAYGTFVGLKAAVKHRFGSDDLQGLRVAIQGVGNVGYRLAEHLKAAGAELYVCDIHLDSVARAVEELGAVAVSNQAIHTLDADAFAPCALGAVLNDETIAEISAPIIAGAANNQLATPQHDQLLKNRGILYTPDFVINSGGIIDVYYEQKAHQHAQQHDTVRSHIESIANTLDEIFLRSETDGLPTGAVANRIAEERFMGKRVSA